MPTRVAILAAGFFLAATSIFAAPLTSASVTEMKNVVRFNDRAAKLRDSISGTDMVTTGERSLAELEFNDKTITRLGSKTVFTFGGEKREFVVNDGLSLICVPKGSGGGKIVTAAITAAIEGTTVLTERFSVAGKTAGDPARPATKYIFIEGRGIIATPDGKQKQPIRGGQMIVHILGDPKLADTQDIDLATLVNESGIVSGFARQLPTWDAIQNAIKRQRVELRRGFLEESRFFLVGRGTQVGKRAMHQPAGYENIKDATHNDSAGAIALSESAACDCQPGPK